MSKYLYILWAIPLVGLLSCDGTSSNATETKKEDTFLQDSIELQQTLHDLKDEYQKFEINPTRDTLIVGRNGTKIHYKKNILQFEDGSQPSETVVLRLVELKNQTDFARNNIQTISDGKLLVSGGSYFIDFVSDEQKLLLKPNDHLNAEFPKQMEEDLFLFYGVVDFSGSINWTNDSSQLKTKLLYHLDCYKLYSGSNVEVYHTVGNTKYDEYGKEIRNVIEVCDTIYNVNKDSLTYEIIELSRLGWTACNVLMDSSEKADLEVQFKNKNVHSANVYLMYKNHNSTVINRIHSTNQTLENNVFHDILVDEEIRLVAINHSNGKLFSYQTDTFLTKDLKISIELKETSFEELPELFQ